MSPAATSLKNSSTRTKDEDEHESNAAGRQISPLFRDVSDKLAHIHHQDPFDDFDRQPLLPRKLSQLGPGMAWCDVDGDGWEDLLIGSGSGGTLALLRN